MNKLDARLPEHAFRLVQANKDLVSIRNLRPDIILKIELRGSLKGGKGGFGSLLRRIKPKAKDDQNYEACRDLSGRRLRHVNNEQRLKEWEQAQKQENQYVEEELKEYEKHKSELKGAIKANNFKLDDAYKQELDKRAKTVAESVQEGARLTGGKRDKKKSSKMPGIQDDLDQLGTRPLPMSSDPFGPAIGVKREAVQDLKSLFAEMDSNKRARVEEKVA